MTDNTESAEPKPAKGAGGRPSAYKPEYAEQAKKLCLLSATDDSLADFFSVDVRTIGNWKNAHPEFLQAIKDGKTVADQNVAQSLYRKATGWKQKQQKLIGDKVVEWEEALPASDTAAIFWLKNRCKEQWRDRHEVTGADGTPLVVEVVKFSDKAAAKP